jgi:hypothetical protein
LDTTKFRTKPKHLAQQMGVRVRVAATPQGWWGVYDHGRRLITLRPGLGPIQSDCTLMHELGHAHYGHIGHSPKQELLADRWAAHRLIQFDDLLEAAGMEQSGPSVACSLGVLPRVLDTYLKTLTQLELRQLREAALKRIA